ncbi:hypothetical protein T12_4262 [Trichinella patagoniensis]|uniref:Uncharacterized protein n=1 Tax=Trichinella patagoniensis TaxID=990121 RepID=A0A0V0ZQS0_9BILA|nr:hypothetical protein T12_4262 [Trichinella patagoniensis]
MIIILTHAELANAIYRLIYVWRFFSENEDKKNYYFYRSCTNNCIPGCTPLDDVENRFMSCVSCCDYDFCNVDNASDCQKL